MHTREQVIDMAMALPGAASDMPFEGDFDSTVLRHSGSRKWFGLLMKVRRDRVGLEGDGLAEVLNLKCDPLVSYGMRQAYPDIVPAYHMNRQLWISVRLEGGVPDEVLRTLIRMSYDLTRGKSPARKPTK